MREIKFRAKAINDGYYKGEWVDGYYTKILQGGELVDVMTDGAHEVPIQIETLGQFTGLKDKNGREIYEGDIVKRTADMRNYAECDGEKVSVFDVEYYGCELLPFSEWGSNMEEYDVIGNVHDNSEWVKKETDYGKK